MKISLRNNVIWLTGAQSAPEWMDEEPGRTGTYTALLDETTSEAFERDFADACNEGDVAISDADYDSIVSFVQNPSQRPMDLVEPPGITLEPYQREAVGICLRHRRFALFFGMGTGKTLMAISILLSRKAESALIVTTKKMVSQYKENLDAYAHGLDYEVTNYEMMHHFVGHTFDVLILDESQAVKNFTSNANSRARAIAQACECCYLFTGTPQDKSRHEILSQLAVLDWRVMPTKSRTYNRFFLLDDYYSPKRERSERKRELDRLIKAYSYGEKASDLLTLPEAHILIYRCPHPPAYYDELMDERIIEESTKGGELTVVGDQPASLRTYLQEICSGSVPFVKTDSDGNRSPEPRYIGSMKDPTLTAIASQVERGICYFWFRCSGNGICNSLGKAGRTFSYVDGSMSSKKSDEAIAAFKSGKVDWLVIQERSGNAGLDLSMVNHVVFYDLPSSYLVYSQCKGRIRRKGQTKECHYHHLLCKGTVEEAMLNALRKKKSFTDRLFGMYAKGEKRCKTKGRY